MMEKSEARAMLPKLGACLMRVPANKLPDVDPIPLPCVVIAVNQRHLWYMVRFKSGVRERYKVPPVKHWSQLPENRTMANHKVKRKRRVAYEL